MKRRAAHNRGIVGKFTAAVLAIAIVMAGGWYLMPMLTELAPGEGNATRALVTSDDVNLRSGPGTSFDVLAVIPGGSELSAEKESVNGFSAVTVDGQHGWIASEYLHEPGTVFAAEHTVAEVAPEEPVVPPASDPERETAVPEPTVAPVVQPPAPTVVPTSLPLIVGSTQVEHEPQPGEKWIEVDRTNRTVTLHNGEIIVATFDALIGKDPSADGYYSTAVGTYYVHLKEKALAETPFADGVYLSDFVGFDPVRSNGFHSPTRDEFGNVVVTGGTATLGCVRLSEADAVFLFDFAYIGMRVEVHD